MSVKKGINASVKCIDMSASAVHTGQTGVQNFLLLVNVLDVQRLFNLLIQTKWMTCLELFSTDAFKSLFPDCCSYYGSLQLKGTADNWPSLISGLLEAFSAFVVATCGIKASRELFVKLYTNIIRVPMRFYDKTPRGRILNRLSEDIMEIDMVMPFSVRSMVNVILVMGGTLGVIIAFFHLFVIVIPPLAIMYYFIQVN